MRLFIGIPLAPEVKEELSSICARLKSNGDTLRWSSAESWHITLQFLGSTREEQYDGIVVGLQSIRAVPVPVSLEGLDSFDRAGVFFASVKVTPKLSSLQQQVTAATAQCGFAPEERDYHPHITLARAGKGDRRAVINLKPKLRNEAKFSGFVAHEFCLYESFLGSSGSKYVVRERFALNG
ncbi:MAG TPA: RNA 2',3'-cyclic phosphodiesterase [Terracidiphilus sp.]|nr:RNA 2',3'-cyclic phosphodiesterase [Terracidiphilus sp.]